MREFITIAENVSPQWPEELEDNYAIADYIEGVSPSYIDHERCAENFRGCRAELKYLPITEISDKHASSHERIPAREKKYAKMNPATIPPLIIDRGVIEDGHHRFRVAKELGLTHLWCYVIVSDEDEPVDESAETRKRITLWHGGRDLESSYNEVRAHAKGRWEHGPGLYLTSHYDTAMKYAKGGGKLYRVTVEQGTEIGDVTVPLQDALDFVNRYVIGSKKKAMIADLKDNIRRRDDGQLRAEVLVNLCLNNEAIPNTKTGALRQFLIDHGVDYAIMHRYGGRPETVLVVINPKIIKKVEIVPASKVKDGFELPGEFS